MSNSSRYYEAIGAYIRTNSASEGHALCVPTLCGGSQISRSTLLLFGKFDRQPL